MLIKNNYVNCLLIIKRGIWPHMNPIVERVGIVLEKYPPKLDLIDSIFDARAIPHRLVDVVGHVFRLFFGR